MNYKDRGLLYPKIFTDAFLFISLLFISAIIYGQYILGGDPWSQADWLTHNLSGSARRGIFGSSLIHIFETLGVRLLLGLCVLQIVLTAVLFAAFRSLAYALKNDAIAILMIMSPAIFAVFWVADPAAVARKELITFVGLTVFALGSVRKNAILLWAGAIVFAIALLAHEAMLIFLPTIFAIMAMNAKDRDANFYAVLVFVILASITSVVYNVFYVSMVSSASMCSDLLTRGFNQHFCSGAIEWIDKDLSYALEKLSAKLQPHRIAAYLAAYALSLAPFIYLLKRSTLRGHVGLVICLTGLPFILLNVIALDWGRWVSFHVFSLAILMMCAFASGFAKMTVAISMRAVAAFTVIALLISPTHIIGMRIGGVLRTLIHAVCCL